MNMNLWSRKFERKDPYSTTCICFYNDHLKCIVLVLKAQTLSVRAISIGLCCCMFTYAYRIILTHICVGRHSAGGSRCGACALFFRPFVCAIHRDSLHSCAREKCRRTHRNALHVCVVCVRSAFCASVGLVCRYLFPCIRSHYDDDDDCCHHQTPPSPSIFGNTRLTYLDWRNVKP